MMGLFSLLRINYRKRAAAWFEQNAIAPPQLTAENVDHCVGNWQNYLTKANVICRRLVDPMAS